MISNSEVVIIGAGVIGLTLGNLLLDSKKYQKVTILAEHIGSSDHPEYCSSKAGAHWRSMAEDKIHEGNSIKIFFKQININSLLRV
jgi:glycine/D-amino acid oxidase-like deaminating enzyme